MVRKIDLGGGAYVIPMRLAGAADREIDAKRAQILIVYPDDTTGEQLVQIIEAATRLEEATDDGA